ERHWAGRGHSADRASGGGGAGCRDRRGCPGRDGAAGAGGTTLRPGVGRSERVLPARRRAPGTLRRPAACGAAGLARQLGAAAPPLAHASGESDVHCACPGGQPGGGHAAVLATGGRLYRLTAAV
ncbi:MAG: hypothetical protein AVDCRST_MAG77-5412, partial [uncultured Chloroflexi bacterium]